MEMTDCYGWFPFDVNRMRSEKNSLFLNLEKCEGKIEKGKIEKFRKIFTLRLRFTPNGNQPLVPPLPKRSAIGGWPKLVSYNMLGEQFHHFLTQRYHNGSERDLLVFLFWMVLI